MDAGLTLNAMTVDVEDYFQVQAFANCVKRSEWDDFPSHVEVNTLKILEIFARFDTRATFFTLGWIAERYPAIVRRIVGAGHELASHGYGHQLVHEMTPNQFREDVVLAKNVLEDIGGVEVKGYRAPTFSIGPRSPWAYNVLNEVGYRYSSSVYPIRHDLYGNARAPRFSHKPISGSFLEFPMSTLRFGRSNMPISGGGYFRLLPYTIFRGALRRFSVDESRSAIFYFHPWEMDARQPRVVGASRRSTFRHYVNISAVPLRLDRLLKDFNWGPMDQVFERELASS